MFEHFFHSRSSLRPARLGAAAFRLDGLSAPVDVRPAGSFSTTVMKPFVSSSKTASIEMFSPCPARRRVPEIADFHVDVPSPPAFAAGA